MQKAGIVLGLFGVFLAGAILAEDHRKMMHACLQGQLAELKALVEAGADVNCQLGGGRTPLMAAVIADKANIVEYLLAKGAYVGARDINGKTALDLALFMGNDDVAAMISSDPPANWVVPDFMKKSSDKPFESKMTWNIKHIGQFSFCEWTVHVTNKSDQPLVIDMVLSALKVDTTSDLTSMRPESYKRSIVDRKDNIKIKPKQTATVEGSFKFSDQNCRLEDLKEEIIPSRSE